MLIQNGTIIDGTGKPRFSGDIRVEKDKIKEIGALQARKKELVIDAKNQFVAPGFIDIINRSDIYFSIFESPGLKSLVKQGITTIVGGNCGASLAPLASKSAIDSVQKWHDITGANVNWRSTEEFLDEVGRHALALNFATLTGHGTMRRGIVGDRFDKLSEDELKKVEYMLESSLAAGSFGFSMGLGYSHEKIVPREELLHLMRLAKKHDGLCTVHLRDEESRINDSVQEVIGLAEASGARCHISHFKKLGAGDDFTKSLEEVHKAKEKGLVLTFDSYPYTRTATVLYLLLPDWAVIGGKRELLKRLRDTALRQKILEELQGKERKISEIIIGLGSINNLFVGKTVGEIAKNQEVSPAETLLNIILSSSDRIIGFMPFIKEENVAAALKSKLGCVASDGAGYSIKDRARGLLFHPRSFGAFPRFLGQYVRDKKIVGWEEAIRKITQLPAEILGLTKRGRVEKGFYADLVIFNPQKIQDKATFQDPFQYADGVTYVLVNGRLALRKGKFQKNRYGQVLRK